jgi:hypothetical protein
MILMSLLAIILGLSLTLPVTGQQLPATHSWQEQIKPLPQLPAGWELIPDSLVVSPDRKRMACKMQRGSGIIVWVDGIPSPVYLKVGKLVFSDNSLNLYYVARERGPWFLTKDYTRKLTREIASDPIVSPNGKAYAVVCKTPQRVQVVTNGKPGPIFDEINVQSIRFSDNDKHLAYFARRGQYWYTQINEQTAGPYEEVIDAPLFDKTSDSPGYMARHNGQWYVVQNNEPWPAANEVAGIQYHPASNELYAWLRIHEQQWQLYHNGQPIDDALSTTPAPITFAKHPGQWAVRLIVGSQTQMMRSGKRLPILGYILPEGIQFDAKSIQLVYVTRTDAGEQITIGDQLCTPCQQIQTSDIRISRDGVRIAYAAKVNDQWCVMDQELPGPAVDDILPGSLQLSPDDQQLIYSTHSGKYQRIYVDHQMVGEFDQLTEPVFNKRGDHLAWAARIGEKWHLYVDGIANASAFTDLVGQPLVINQNDNFLTMIQQAHTVMPSFGRLVMEKQETSDTDSAIATVDPNSIK